MVKQKNNIRWFVLGGIIIIALVLASNFSFQPKIADCRVTKVDYDKTFQGEITKYPQITIDITISNFGNKECELSSIWASGLLESIDPWVLSTGVKFQTAESKIIPPKESKMYSLTAYGHDPYEIRSDLHVNFVFDKNLEQSITENIYAYTPLAE